MKGKDEKKKQNDSKTTPTKTEQSTSINELPLGVLGMIAERLDRESLGRFNQTSKRMHKGSTSVLGKEKCSYYVEKLNNEAVTLPASEIVKTCKYLLEHRISKDTVFKILVENYQHEINKMMNPLFSKPNEERCKNYEQALEEIFPVSSCLIPLNFFMITEGGGDEQFVALSKLVAVKIWFEHCLETNNKEGLKEIKLADVMIKGDEKLIEVKDNAIVINGNKLDDSFIKKIIDETHYSSYYKDIDSAEGKLELIYRAAKEYLSKNGVMDFPELKSGKCIIL
ncbi:TPA: hypothetical protein OX050_001603 [Legionella pneumophila]|uniref:F-box protein n=1 Tax=Legionella pneumophila TaxID=446 RepID=UPI00048740B1|nr:F-box protein [Legionella pneumophila]MCK0183279.1 hypothetical protein [Legionella pneumophila]MCK1879899.1 hypothetical protein [Legionella pneumophila]MCK1888771.1 hypothetical protein [Legionella pneumophila]MCZ4701330.1 F-box protein [Legionella pneumophila]MCZ4730939.1 F-box protein [Legionella pneumophila]